MKGYDDATLVADPSAFPEVKRHKLPRKGKEASPVISGKQATLQALLQPLRQLRRPREMSQTNPEAEIMAQDSRWHKIARYDSAIVSLPDQTSAAFYRRDRDKFVDQLKRTVAIHRTLAAEWDDLAERYRAALPHITSPEAWEETFRPAERGDGMSSSTVGRVGRRRRAQAPAAPRRRRGAAAVTHAPSPATNGLLEVFRRRYLLRLLVRSTIDARYQGTVLGWAWSYVQPAVRFCLYYFVFQVFIGRGAGIDNFAIHLFAGMVVVHFFTETFNGGTKSLVSNRGLIVKLPMPRELFPVATMLVALWHSGPMLVILTGACLFLGWTPDPMGLLAGLLGFLIIAFLGLALSLVFSVANVFFRDFGKVTQTLTQFVTFSVPMIYPFSLVERFALRVARQSTC